MHGPRCLLKHLTLPAALLACVVAGVVAREAAATAWREARDEDGIKVSRALVPGSDVVKFRAVGNVEASLKEVFSVIYDLGRRCEWMERCAEARIVKWISSREAVGYFRIEGSGLIASRDTVFRATSAVSESDKWIRISFKEINWPTVPPREGIVRMPLIEGYWQVQRVGPTTTEVIYEVHGDPGGWIPTWIVNWVSENLPFSALTSLRAYIRDGKHQRSMPAIEKLGDWSVFE